MSVIRNVTGRGLAALLALGALSASAPAVAPVPAIDAGGLKKQLAARKGKVVVVNFWATWCGPCVEEFPSLVKLHKANKARGLDLITISCDDKRDAPKVSAFITKSGQSSGAYHNTSSTEIEGYLKYLEPKLSGEEAIGIPRTYVFNRQGKLVKTMVGGQSYAAFQSAVAPLLKK